MTETSDSLVTEGAAAADFGSLSAGGDLHEDGKCKPCVFYHEPEGCHNGTGCTFCHACPPREFERRKRLRRNLLKPKSRAGHHRQGSDASTTASTASERKLSHSRQSSGVGSMHTSGDVRRTSAWTSPEGATADQATNGIVDSLELHADAGDLHSTGAAMATTSSRQRRRARRQQGRFAAEEFKESFTSPVGTYMMVPMTQIPMQMHDEQTHLQQVWWNSPHDDLVQQPIEQNQFHTMWHSQPWHPALGADMC